MAFWASAFQHDTQQLNLYAYVRNNPVTATDRQGEAAETIWDVANIAIGVVSLVDNVKQGNVFSAVVDGAGILIDSAAAVVPFVPGGAGAGIRAARGGAAAVEVALETVTTGDRALDAARSAAQGRTILSNKVGSGIARQAVESVGSAAESVLSSAERAGLRELFGKSVEGAKDLLGGLRAGADVALPSSVTRETLKAYRDVAERAITQGKDTLGVQALRREAIDLLLKQRDP